jgi:hypothetical protein
MWLLAALDKVVMDIGVVAVVVDRGEGRREVAPLLLSRVVMVG